jgi:hypothetical protein
MLQRNMAVYEAAVRNRQGENGAPHKNWLAAALAEVNHCARNRHHTLSTRRLEPYFKSFAFEIRIQANAQ